MSTPTIPRFEGAPDLPVSETAAAAVREAARQAVYELALASLGAEQAETLRQAYQSLADTAGGGVGAATVIHGWVETTILLRDSVAAVARSLPDKVRAAGEAEAVLLDADGVGDGVAELRDVILRHAQGEQEASR